MSPRSEGEVAPSSDQMLSCVFLEIVFRLCSRLIRVCVFFISNVFHVIHGYVL